MGRQIARKVHGFFFFLKLGIIYAFKGDFLTEAGLTPTRVLRAELLTELC